MSARIAIKNALKRFGENVIIPDLTMEIKPGELFTLLGPSGCGKTTLLRMIAGFNSIEGGEFFLNDTLINNLDPGKRNIGMVFQNYAIFPHLSVRKNVEFGLRHRKTPKKEIAPRVDKALQAVQMVRYADRMPERLSGGQQQRVALARALVIEPEVLLMDEPLSNLDAKLRVEMRSVIKHIQRSVGITTVYVTHDQEEAMAISDRLAVMKDGVIQHLATPKVIYQRPANQFVATFIGRSNILSGELKVFKDGCRIALGNVYSIELDNVQEQYQTNRQVVISARPEELLVQYDSSKPGIGAVVEDSVFLGLNTHYSVKLDTGEDAEIIQESTIDSIIPPGTRINLALNAKKINVFTRDGNTNILTGVHNEI